MPRSLSLAIAAGLGVAAVATFALAAPALDPLTEQPVTKTQDRAITALARADLDGPRAPDMGPRGSRDFAPPPPPPGERFGPRGPREGRRPPVPLAARLAEQETAIGIRSNQLDAWRDYSDALQAMLAPPKPPAGAAAEPFAVERAMAEDGAARGEAAERLRSAIDVLKSKLSSEQLERAGLFAAPPPPPFGGPRPPHAVPGEPAPGPGEMERGPVQPG